jgi:predicted transcriptional regulator
MIPHSTIQGAELLHVVMFGHLHFQSLRAGVELGIFEILEEGTPQTTEQLAEATGLARQPMKMVLANLCALGLVEQREGSYTNGPSVRRFLLSSSDDSVVNIVKWLARIVYPGIEDYVRSLKENTNVGIERFAGSGKTIYERLTWDPELEKIFQDAMAQMPSNRFLAGNLQLGERLHLCDCGGGAGRNAIEIARLNPHLRVTIFDHPTVCAKARANIEKNGLSERVSTYAGNFLEDGFPTGIDCVLYSHIASIWSVETNVGVFRRAHDALPAGGSLFIYNMVANDEHTGPLSVACGSVYFHALATGEGFMHSAREYQAMLKDAGFAAVEIIDNLQVSHVLITGTK